MHLAHELPARRVVAVFVCLFAPVLTVGCGESAAPNNANREKPTLRVGIGGLPSQTADRGVLQFISNISNEGLLRVNREGRLEPWLVESWHTSTDGLLVTLRLRPHVTFHDGSPLDAAAAARSLRDTLPKALGAVFEDIDSIAATSDAEVTIRFRRPSPFVLESFIDNPVQKPGNAAIGSGPFMAKAVSPNSKSSPAIEAYAQYDLGPARIGRIVVDTYPNVRAAWADLLRDRLDMLYEVSVDALESMQGATNVALYAFDRPFQYILILNSRLPKLKSREVRRALNQAVDRQALVRDALSTHGTPSAGPVSQHHWAFRDPSSTFDYIPASAAATLAATHSGRMSLKCLAPAGPPYERLALMLKQQLQEVGVDMTIDEVAPESIITAMSRPDFEAELLEISSGWGLFRPYRWWHSTGTLNVLGFSSPNVDAALDRLRNAANDDDYRAGVAAFQQAIADDPPAVFLAWGDRSRAVSSRFDVQAQTGRDVLASLRLWRPTAETRAGHN